MQTEHTKDVQNMLRLIEAERLLAEFAEWIRSGDQRSPHKLLIKVREFLAASDTKKA